MLLQREKKSKVQTAESFGMIFGTYNESVI